MRTFVIGDIHGCTEELDLLLDHIFDKEDFNPAEDHFVFMGDYIDRGFNSKKVIETLIWIKNIFPESVFLRGNHEDMLLSFLGIDGNYGNMFFYNGGKITLFSYIFVTT